jgi:acetyl-CoA C-acetyltransferase
MLCSRGTAVQRLRGLAGLFHSVRPLSSTGSAVQDEDVYFLSFARTPIGSFGGKLAHLTAVELGVIAVNAAVARAARLEPDLVTDCYLGQVLTAGCGQSPARQVALRANLPETVRCLTVNKVCASGMKAITLAYDAIRLGHAEIVVAGGMESMSNAPFYLMENEQLLSRRKYLIRGRLARELGNRVLYDGLLLDGLLDSYSRRGSLKGASTAVGAEEDNADAGYPMSYYADRLASNMGILREEQDNFAVHSYSRAAKATAQQLFAKEIVPVELPTEFATHSSPERFSDSSRTTSGGPDTETHGTILSPEHLALLKSDEERERLEQIDRMPRLAPLFPGARPSGAKGGPEGPAGGTITAGNASKLSDGAAALVLASGRAVRRYNLLPLARMLSHADAEQEPERFATTPALALPLALSRAGLKLSNLDYLEINEAFACVPIMVLRLLAATHAADGAFLDPVRARAAAALSASASSSAAAAAAAAAAALPRSLGSAGTGTSAGGVSAPTGLSSSAALPDIISSEHVNAWGGAIALGHPLGCSGARIVVTLTNILRSRTARYGAATICNGGGGATALVLERVDMTSGG